MPLFFLASTTIIFLLNPLIILFLSGKFIFSGLVPNGNSEIIAPSYFNILSTKYLFYSTSSALPVALPFDPVCGPDPGAPAPPGNPAPPKLGIPPAPGAPPID